ncbi:MAG: sulfatase-like hydrolase/transferase [Pseudomonadales bacterium]
MENTLVVFLSDKLDTGWNTGIDGGSAQPFRGGKGTPFEGGWRVPAILNWPNHLKAGSYVKINFHAGSDADPRGSGRRQPSGGRADIDGQNLMAANIPGENDSFLYFADYGSPALPPHWVVS